VALWKQRQLSWPDPEDRSHVPAGRVPDARLHRALLGAIDAAWYNGGKATVNGVAGNKVSNVGIGLTLGYQIKDNLNLTFGYKSTVNDNAPGDLRMDSLMVSLVYGWNPLIEGMRRLKSEQQRNRYSGPMHGPDSAYTPRAD
jgi:hypothetical protein